MKRLTMLLGAGILFLCSTVFAAVPQLINFQGILRDGSGNPVADGAYSVVFTIYDAPSGGTNLWSETQLVTTASGLFTVLLGNSTPVPDTAFNDSSRYLGVKVGADPEMTPRQRLSSVGFSQRSSEWTTLGQNLFRLSGSVGIGTTTTQFNARLEVADRVNVIGTGTSRVFIGKDGGEWLEASYDAGLAKGQITTGSSSQPLILQGIGGRVGVGTDSPGASLEVYYDNLTPTAPAIAINNPNPGGQNVIDFRFSGTSQANIRKANGGGLFIGTTVSNALNLFTNFTNRLTITEGGNLGIGTISPQAKLEVFNLSGSNPDIHLSDGDVAHGMTAEVPTNVAGRIGPFSSTDGGMVFQGFSDADAQAAGLWGTIGVTNPTDAVAAVEIRGYKKSGAGRTSLASSETILGVNNGGGTNLLVVQGGGNIGIGTSSPAARLHVAAGNLNLEHSTASVGNILKGGFPFIHNYGPENTFIGLLAGNLTMGGTQNTACGYVALFSNGTGSNNTASGHSALVNNTEGFFNTANGSSALGGNTYGNGNTACGYGALASNSTGSYNTASGNSALSSNTAGNENTAVGSGANVSAGNLTNATAIGSGAVVNASNKIRLGNSLVTVLECQVGLTVVSDRNQKENFRPVDGEEVLRKIQGLPLSSWNYKGHDPKEFRHYGPMAQDFFAAFGNDGVGKIGTETTLNSGDVAGILMIAVQALGNENAELKGRIEQLEKKLKDIGAEKPQAEVR